MKTILRAILLALFFSAPVYAQQQPQPFAPVAQNVSISAPNGSSSASTALPGAFAASTVQVYNSGTVPITFATSRVSGGATASATSTPVAPGASGTFYIGSGVFDVAVYGIGGTATVYLQAGNGGSAPTQITGAITPGDCAKFYSTTAIEDSGGACGAGGSMTWPGVAGIALYSGSNSWSTSITTLAGLNTELGVTIPSLSGTITTGDIVVGGASSGQLANIGTPTNCSGAGSLALGITVTGASNCHTLADADIPGIAGTPTSGQYWGYNGTAQGWYTPSGSGTVNSGTTNQVGCYLASGTAISGCTTLPTAAMPAMSGDCTSSAGSTSLTCSKVNGASVPASAAVLSSNASSQLAAAATTGSGSVVLATSPTLVTPALGTPSALTLTNATGLPVSGISATGTASSTTFLEGDGKWAAPTGSGTVNSGTSGEIGCYLANGTAISGCSPLTTIGYLNEVTPVNETASFTPADTSNANGEYTMSCTAACTFTVPPNSSVAYPVGTVLTISQLTASIATLTPGAGVTLQSTWYGASTSQTYALAQYGFIQIQQTATNTWQVVTWQAPHAQGQGTYALSGTCTTSANNGNAKVGTITLSSAGSCTLILTFSGIQPAITGWNGVMWDQTQLTVPMWGNSGAATNSITFTVPAAAAIADVLRFSVNGSY